MGECVNVVEVCGLGVSVGGVIVGREGKGKVLIDDKGMGICNICLYKCV